MNTNDFNIRNRINRLLPNRTEEKAAPNASLFNRVNKVYGRDTEQTDNEQNNSIVSIFPKVRNPFAANNAIVRNAPVMNTDNMSGQTRSFINSIFNNGGILQNQTAAPASNNINLANISAGDNTGSDSGSVQAAGSADGSNLGSMDVKTELPKLSVSQIATIIKKHFGNSKVMSPNDAQGIYDAQQSTGMSALAMLGIGALESGWGTSKIANKTNNIWGYGATNVNPEGNAHRYSQMSQGAKQFAKEFMKTYYNGYGAKSINSAGTGSNPKGMGYAYNDDGSISSTWAPEVSNIMSKLYNTAKGAGSFSTAASGGDDYGSDGTNDSAGRVRNIMNSFLNRGFGGNNSASNNNGKINKYFTVMPSSLQNTLFGNGARANVLNLSSMFGQDNSGETASGRTGGNSSRSSGSIGGGNNGIVSTASKYIGVPYVWGGTSPDGFDCSGLVQYVMNKNGISVPRTSQEQFKAGTAVSKNDLQPGDAVFFKGSGGSSSAPGHVGIYVGGGQYIQAPRTGDKVKYSSLNGRSDYVGARRYR